MNGDIIINRDNGKSVNINPVGGENGFSPIRFERGNENNDNSSELGLEFIMNKDARDLANKIESDRGDDVSVNGSQSEQGSGFQGNENDMFSSYQGGIEEDPYSNMSYEDIEREKTVYLSKLNRMLANPSIQGRRLNITNSLQEIKGEVFRIQKDIEITNGINYSKQGLMFCINTIEMLSKNYMDTLNGWSNVVMTDINNNSYDQVLEELYEKYSKHISMGPEIKLISMIAGSAFMFSLQKSLVDRSLNNPGLLETLIGKFTSKGSKENTPSPKTDNMSGPSFNVDDIDDIDDISSVSSIEITPPKKKPGRKKKKN